MGKEYWIIIAALAFSSCASVSNEEVGFRKANIPPDAGAPIVAQFTGDNLTAPHLKAFEQRAIEKLQDLSDYLQIISDSSYSEEFRNAAILQAQDMFIDHSQIRLVEGKEPYKVNSFLMETTRDTAAKLFLFKNIVVKDTLRFEAEILYEGSLSFKYGMVKKGDTIWNEQDNRIAEFYLMKTQKNFGPSEKMIWEVFLGNIY